MRRQQLIDSTVAVLARKGYAGLTVADVAKEAGLSVGIVIFHFASKDGLLAAVLGALAAEYRAHWEASVNAAGPAAADRLKALERENRELRQANEILRKASAYFAQAELDRPFKR